MWTAEFWKDTAERVIGTAAALLIAYFTTAGVTDLSASWKSGLVTVGVGCLVTLLKSLLAATRQDTVSPASLVK